MKNKQQIAYVITKHSDPNSKLIDYLVNRANCITINDCYVDINYGFSSDKKVVDKTSDTIDAYLLDFKKRIIGYADIIILDYTSNRRYDVRRRTDGEGVRTLWARMDQCQGYACTLSVMRYISLVW